MQRLFVHGCALGALFTFFTYLVGWWCLPAIGALYGLAERSGMRAAAAAALGVALSWGLLLILALARPAGWTLLQRFGDVLAMPAGLPVAICLLFGMLLAASAAAVPSCLFMKR